MGKVEIQEGEKGRFREKKRNSRGKKGEKGKQFKAKGNKNNISGDAWSTLFIVDLFSLIDIPC